MTEQVFISYSHDSENHKDKALSLSDKLREYGLNCEIDQYIMSPSIGWPKWMEKTIEESDFVLVICTQNYLQKFKGQGSGAGVNWEGAIITQELYNKKLVNSKFIPIIFDYSDEDFIPSILQGVTFYCLKDEDGFDELYRRLTNQPKIKKPPLGTRVNMDYKQKISAETRKNYNTSNPHPKDKMYAGFSKFAKEASIKAETFLKTEGNLRTQLLQKENKFIVQGKDESSKITLTVIFTVIKDDLFIRIKLSEWIAGEIPSVLPVLTILNLSHDIQKKRYMELGKKLGKLLDSYLSVE